MTLTPAEIERFHREGYLVPGRPLLPPERIERLRQRFEARLGDWQRDFRQRPEQMDKPHFLYPEFLDDALDPLVLDVVEGLIGPDIALFTTHFICKPPSIGQRVPWHEDSAYWAGMIEPMDAVLTIWLALDPSTTANGCLRVIPGSHLRPDCTYTRVADVADAVFATEITAGSFDESQARDLVLEPGQCSIHHARTIHGSEPNRGTQRRCGFTMRYFSTRCRFTHHDADPDFRIYLARGRDLAGNRYADPAEVNHAWRDRLLAGTA